MNLNLHTLTNAEKKLMEIFWESKEPMKFSEISHECEDTLHLSWKPQTLYTHLTNLTKKGFLVCERSGYKKTYRLSVSKEELEQQSLRKIFRDTLQGSLKNLLLTVSPDCHLTSEDAKELHKWIDETFTAPKEDGK